MTPTLSPLERSRIAAAVQAGPVRWRAIGRRLSYLAGGKEHVILTAPTDRVFWCLVEQAKEEYRRNAEALEAAKKKAESPSRPVEVGGIPPVRCELPLCDLPESLDAGGAHGEQRNFEQGA